MRVAILTSDNRERFKDYDHPAPYFGPAPGALLQGFAALSGVEVHVVSCLQKPAASPEKIAENMWFHGLHVPKIGWMRTLYQGSIRATRKKLREIRPDIVHGEGTERDCAVSAVFSGFQNVLTIHGNMLVMAEFHPLRGMTSDSLFYRLAARLETLALKKAGGVFCNSAYTESLVSPRTQRVWRVPNALRTEFFSKPPMPLCRPILLNIGEISPRKRQLEILAVARRLWERGLRFEMQFAGAIETHTGYGSNFMRRVAEGEAAGYARHIGTLQINELIAAMDAASALVHFPSEEAFGLVVAEALARNLKFFGAATGGIVDIATGVEGAELFPGNDWAALENAVARWLESGCPRPKTANETMRLRYAPEIIARRHLEIYKEVLADGHRG